MSLWVVFRNADDRRAQGSQLFSRSRPQDETDTAEGHRLGSRRDSPAGLAQSILDIWEGLPEARKIAFLVGLAEQFGPNLSDVAAAVRTDPSESNTSLLYAVTESDRQEIIQRLNKAPAATSRLVAMRESADARRAADLGRSGTDEIPPVRDRLAAVDRAQCGRYRRRRDGRLLFDHQLPALQGISFGGFLIKQVTELLKRELPNLKKFVTLLPVPGFGRWLATLRKKGEDARLPCRSMEMLALLDRENWEQDSEACSARRAHSAPATETEGGRPG